MNTDPNRKRLLHVFFVQSYISYLMCRAIIHHKALDNADVLFLLDRGISIPAEHRQETAPQDVTHQPSKSPRNILQNRRKKRRALAFLAQVTGGRPVELYINKMSQPAYFLFTRLPSLQAVNLYEEGFAAYYMPLGTPSAVSPGRVNLKHRAVQMLSGFPVAHGDAFYLDTYKQVFGSSEQAFPDFPRRVTLDLMPVIAGERDAESFSEITTGATIFAMPQLFVFRNNPDLAQALEDVMVACIETSASTTYFKLHPDRYDASEIISRLAQRVKQRTGVDFRDHLVPDLPLEVIATRRPDIVIAILVSSLAIYARFFACRVISFAKPVYGPDFPKVRTLIPHSPQTIFVEPGEDHDSIRTRLRSAGFR